MSNLITERVTHVHHWDENLFSFKTSRDPSFRFHNGHFTMIGLKLDGRPVMRAYSIVSANYEEELEFFSIKVPDGPLTSRLQHLKVGDELLLSRKPTGTLLVDNLLPGRNLYLIATGTGLRHAQLTALSLSEMKAAIRHARAQDWRAFVLVSHSFEMMNRDRGIANRTVQRRFEALCQWLAEEPGVTTGTFADPAVRERLEGQRPISGRAGRCPPAGCPGAPSRTPR